MSLIGLSGKIKRLMRYFWLGLAGVCVLLMASPSAYSQAKRTNQDLLREIVRFDMIGAQITYIENLIGPAWKIIGRERVYRINGCVLFIGTKDLEVRYFKMSSISKKCQFDLNAFPYGADVELSSLTFGDFGRAVRGDGVFQSPCLYLCADERTVYHWWQAPRAGFGILIRLEVQILTKAATVAMTAWADAIRKGSGEAYLDDAKFNCDGAYNEIAHQMFRDVPVTGIAIGYDLPTVVDMPC